MNNTSQACLTHMEKLLIAAPHSQKSLLGELHYWAHYEARVKCQSNSIGTGNFTTRKPPELGAVPITSLEKVRFRKVCNMLRK